MAVNYPPLLIPLSLVFWGWRSDAAGVAGVLLALVFLSKHSPWRWSLGRSQYHRIGDLTTLLFLGITVYFAGSSTLVHPVYALLRWLPALFAPLLLAQIYGTDGKLPLSALFYSLRRREHPGTLDFRLPYALICVVAAGNRPSPDGAYLGGAALLILWTLWCNRPRIQAVPVWLLGFAVAAGLGYQGQLGLARLQLLLEEWALSWIGDMDMNTDPYRTRTSIGDLGRLKLSGRIVLRVESDVHLIAPLLLKETSYDRYQGRQWFASKPNFTPYAVPHGNGPRRVTVSPVEARHDLLLALPGGLRSLDLLPPKGELMGNRLGAVQWQDAPPVVRYRVRYDPAAPDTTPPSSVDLEVQVRTAAMLQPLVEQLGLRHLPPQRAVAEIAAFFARDFRYSLFLGEQNDSIAALQEFLFQRRSGHCEYFATATALLLRAAGVPARFVVGYSVDEFSEPEQVYLARARHAHAWTEAYVDGAWRSLDNTPSIWAEAEAETDPWWQAAADVWARWLSAWRNWRWEQAQQPERQGFPLWGWLLVPLSLWLAWRLYRSRKRMPARTPKFAAGSASSARPPDAAWLRLEQELAHAGHAPRAPGETPLRWLHRIGREEHVEDAVAYYGRRFGNREGRPP